MYKRVFNQMELVKLIYYRCLFINLFIQIHHNQKKIYNLLNFNIEIKI